MGVFGQSSVLLGFDQLILDVLAALSVFGVLFSRLVHHFFWCLEDFTWLTVNGVSWAPFGMLILDGLYAETSCWSVLGSTIGSPLYFV